MFISGLGIALCIWLSCQCIQFDLVKDKLDFVFINTCIDLNIHEQSDVYRIRSFA